jgi:hypothetical protein
MTSRRPYAARTSGALASEDVPTQAARLPSWEIEFQVPDYNKFAGLTAADPVGDLRLATGGDLGPTVKSFSPHRNRT